jgi:tRNA A-37 threonylcarbamoyl transferase component Bud32
VTDAPHASSGPQDDVADSDEAEYRHRLARALGDDYELRELIGRGGFGSVYRAWDRRLDREVAVKALRHDIFPTRGVLERFEREAKAVARLRHPNILPVYTVGAADSLAFMIMPFIQGENLRSVLERERTLVPREALRIAAQVARALAAAHRLGIVHRDVKPENILLEREDRLALLADFGIAKSPPEGDATLTRPGTILGSLLYMSPEQTNGQGDLSPSADLYSLGVVTYEMLAGRRPYEAANFPQLIFQQVTTTPPGIAGLVPGLSAEASEAIMRALESEPGNRWASAADFAKALEDSGAGGPQFVQTGLRSQRSWLDARGPVGFLLALLLYYISIATHVLPATGQVSMAALGLVTGPLIALCQLALAALLVELAWNVVQVSRGTGGWRAAWRAGFEQPSWWQAWYPSSLRHPSSAWDRMPWLVKTLRTILWLDLALVPVALPVLVVIPQMAQLAASVNLLLPMTARLPIAFIKAVEAPAMVALGLLLVGIFWLSTTRRVPIAAVVRCLLTWRIDRWTSTEARRLLTLRKPTGHRVVE